MKDENKELQKQIAIYQKDRPVSLEKKLEEQMTELQKMQRRFDTVRCENQKKRQFLDELDGKLKELEVDSTLPGSEASPQMRQIRVLENRLDKAMIKYNEAQSIRKTYEQIVKRLKNERIGFDNQLAAIERTLKAKERDYEELLLLSHDAYHAKEMAQAELHRFEQGVMEERNQRDKEVQEKKALVQQRERMLRQQQDLDRAGELALKTTTAMAELASSMSHNEAEEEKLRMQEFEDAFRRIKEATGVLDVNEVIQKFLTQEETQNNLFALTKDNQQRIDQLEKEKEQMKQLVDELKYSAAGA